jgi:cyclophilin family peptidyl-prolyl cis-trans isomerase
MRNKVFKGVLIAMAIMFSAASADAQINTTPAEKLVLETTKGEIIIALRPDLAPEHVQRVKELVAEGFYNNVIFHRIIKGFMAQTGDPTGLGSGGSTKPDLKAEFTDTPFVRGTVGAARTGNPNSANSQFFITFAETSHLDGQYTVWGQVISGMDVVDALNVGEPPANPDKIITMTLSESGAEPDSTQ